MKPGRRRLLGFDYGIRNIGVAVGQELTGASTPLSTLHATGGEPDWDAIARLIEEWRPDALVVGIPLNMDGSEQEMTEQARRFARRLAGRFQLPVHHADERLSSVEAVQLLHQRDPEGRRLPRRRRGIDEVAAQIILQTYMSQETGHGEPGLDD